MKVVLETWKELPRYWATSLRSAGRVLHGNRSRWGNPGVFHELWPARRLSRDGKDFGNGIVEGVVAPETAAHAAGTSALLPMITSGFRIDERSGPGCSPQIRSLPATTAAWRSRNPEGDHRQQSRGTGSVSGGSGATTPSTMPLPKSLPSLERRRARP